jgi:hypothetical protein
MAQSKVSRSQLSAPAAMGSRLGDFFSGGAAREMGKKFSPTGAATGEAWPEGVTRVNMYLTARTCKPARRPSVQQQREQQQPKLGSSPRPSPPPGLSRVDPCHRSSSFNIARWMRACVNNRANTHGVDPGCLRWGTRTDWLLTLAASLSLSLSLSSRRNVLGLGI